MPHTEPIDVPENGQKEIKGVEVFSVGFHNGKDFTMSALRSMVRAFDVLSWKPSLKIGHTREPGKPAWGWVGKLRIKGEKLIADIIDVPEFVHDMIMDRRFDNVSVEIFMDFADSKERKFSHVVTAVALLGAEVPAVTNLKPLREVVFENEGKWGETTKHERPFIFHDDKEAKENEMNGIEFVVGSTKGKEGVVVQSALFDKSTWNEDAAKKWMTEHRLDPEKVDVNETTLRYKIKNSDEFIIGTFKTISSDDYDQESGSTNNHKEEIMAIDEKKVEALSNKMDAILAKKDEELEARDKEVEELKVSVEKANKERDLTKEELLNSSDDQTTKRLITLQNELDQNKSKLMGVTEANEKMSKKHDALLEEQRKERITRKSNGLQIPGLRPHIKAFFNMATKPENAGEVVSFSADLGSPKEMTYEAIVDSFIQILNKQAEHKLFTPDVTIEQFKREDRPVNENPSEEVDTRINEYIRKHNLDLTEDYETAMNAVLAEDKGLAAQYAAN